MKKSPLPAKEKRGDRHSPEEQAKRSEMVRQATGTTNDALQDRLLSQAFGTVPAGIEGEPNKRACMALVEGLMGIAPQDGPESMLAVQMVGAHEAAMECIRRAMHPKISAQARDLHLKHAAKFMSLYPQQMGALDRHRGKGQQKITVEHVTVEAGGQAIVGNVEAPARAPSTAAPAPLALPNAPDNGVPLPDSLTTPARAKQPARKNSK